MKLKLTTSLLFMALLISVSVKAQDVIFKVLASKGTNKVTSNNKTSDITIGRKLQKGDKIIVGDNCYLGLAHAGGKTIEIKTPGSYEVSKLSAEVAVQNKGVCKKYVDFIVGEMTSQDEDMSKNKYKYMAVTGSVERPPFPEVKSNLPKDAKVLNGPVELRWEPLKTESQYILTVTNLFSDTVFIDTLSKTSAVIDLSKYNFKEDKIYKWDVKVLNGKSYFSGRMLRAIPEDEESELLKEMTSIQQELGKESALNKFVLANIYSEKGLFVNAISCYERAIKLAPEVDDFKIAYGQFLEENKLATTKAKE